VIETAARMWGSHKSRGYCLDVICADFLADAQLDNGTPKILLASISRYYRFLPSRQKQEFLSSIGMMRRWPAFLGPLLELILHFAKLHSDHEHEENDREIQQTTSFVQQQNRVASRVCDPLNQGERQKHERAQKK